MSSRFEDDYLQTFSDLGEFFSPRPGEKKLGQTVQNFVNFFSGSSGTALFEQDLQRVKDEGGAQFCLVGVPEDIGPRANLGRGGATAAFAAAMSAFLNMQSNRFFDGRECLFLGAVKTADLQVPSDIPRVTEDTCIIQTTVDTLAGRIALCCAR
jgi:formiminoglutamase